MNSIGRAGGGLRLSTPTAKHVNPAEAAERFGFTPFELRNLALDSLDGPNPVVRVVRTDRGLRFWLADLIQFAKSLGWGRVER